MKTVTRKKRLNLTLNEEMDQFLQRLSKQDRTPVATKAVQLLGQSLEQESDKLWSELAHQRHADTKKWVNHDLAWGNV